MKKSETSTSKKTKYIVITGGVYSGLGKGVVSASISALLSRKHKIVNIKWDGYHNHNPGTMNPIEHGEVFVLEDGTEADLDFGHYERFTGVHATGEQSITRGKLNKIVAVLEEEGKRYEGKTIEEIPHVRDTLSEHIIDVAEKQRADIVLFEIGGTVGDDAASLGLHTARMFQHRFGSDNVMYVHIVPMCYTVDDDEPKTRPAQNSIKELMSYGIEPDIVIVRTKSGRPLAAEQRRKLSESSTLKERQIIDGRSLKSVYSLPLLFLTQGVDDLIAEGLHISVPGVSDDWVRRVKAIEQPKGKIRVALCGKYATVKDSYASVNEALTHAGAARNIIVETTLISTEDEAQLMQELANADAIIVPGGYGSRGIEGKIAAIRYAREHKIPYLGLCYGMQLAVVEFARNVCGLADAHTTEVNPSTSAPVVALLPEQEHITVRSGTQRLGTQEAVLREGSLAAEAYGKTAVSERHRHRYEVNPEFHVLLSKHGLVISGVHAKNKHIAEFIELPREKHPYFIATQAHPELKSTLLVPAPLFQGLVDAALAKTQQISRRQAVTAEHNL